MKKCPVCNSTKYDFVNGAWRCARCGYTNKSNDKIVDNLVNQ